MVTPHAIRKSFIWFMLKRSLSNALTAKGSACSHVMDDPHVAFLAASGRDSGRTSTMKRMLNIVMSVASMIT